MQGQTPQGRRANRGKSPPVQAQQTEGTPTARQATAGANVPPPEEDGDERPRIVCSDGTERTVTAEPWTPIRSDFKNSELLKSYLAEQLSDGSSFVGYCARESKKRKRKRTDDDLNDDFGEDQSFSGSEGRGRRNKRKKPSIAPMEDEVSEEEEEEEDSEDNCGLSGDSPVALTAIFNDPCNPVTLGNPGAKQLLSNKTPWDVVRAMVVGYNCSVPEEIYCHAVARYFNDNVLPTHNANARSENAALVGKIERGLLSEDDLRNLNLVDARGRRVKLKFSPSGKICNEHRNLLMMRGLAGKWTAQAVMNQRALQLNPINDLAEMALRYKQVSNSLMESGMLFENTKECYPNGQPVQKLNLSSFRAMLQSDKAYREIVGSKAWLSIYSNRTSAANLGLQLFQDVGICVEGGELAEVTKRRVTAPKGKGPTGKGTDAFSRGSSGSAVEVTVSRRTLAGAGATGTGEVASGADVEKVRSGGGSAEGKKFGERKKRRIGGNAFVHKKRPGL